jgi:hypothetical protein
MTEALAPCAPSPSISAITRVFARYAGEGWGGGWPCEDLLVAPLPVPPPSRLRACPLPASLKVTKPRQAGVWSGEGTHEPLHRSLWDRGHHQ